MPHDPPLHADLSESTRYVSTTVVCYDTRKCKLPMALQSLASMGCNPTAETMTLEEED